MAKTCTSCGTKSRTVRHEHPEYSGDILCAECALNAYIEKRDDAISELDYFVENLLQGKK